MAKYKKTVTAKNIFSYFTEHVGNFLDRDDSLLSKEAIEMLSNTRDREDLLNKLEKLKLNPPEFNENSVLLDKELESNH